MRTSNEHLSENKILTPVTPDDLESARTAISLVEGFKMSYVHESGDHSMYVKGVETFSAKMYFWRL